MTNRTASATLTPFDKQDFDSFAGAEAFPDGTPPLIAYYDDWVVIVCAGLEGRACAQLIDNESMNVWSADIPLQADAVTLARAALDMGPSNFLLHSAFAQYFDQIN